MSATAARQFPAFPIVAEIANEKIEIITKAIEKICAEKQRPDADFFTNLKRIAEFERHLLMHGLEETAAKFDGTFRRVIPFGSCATDMGTNGSDLDICIVIEEKEWSECQDTAKVGILEWVMEVIDDIRYFNGYMQLINGTVPIIRITQGDIDVDISVYYGKKPPPNMKSVQMINAYSQLDHRFAPLFVFVRQWLKKFLEESSSSKVYRAVPNSYSTSLLLINFMHYYGMVPVLWRTHNALLDPKKTTWEELVNWKIKEYPIKRGDWIFTQKRKQTSRSLGQMFVAFLSHYANTVCLENTIIRSAVGKTQPKTFTGHRGLLIYDPYDTQNPGRRMNSANAFTSLLKRALEALKSCESADGLIEALWKVELNYAEIGRRNKKGVVPSSVASKSSDESSQSEGSQGDKDDDTSLEEDDKPRLAVDDVDMSEWWSEPEFWKSPEQIQDEKDLAEGWIKAKPSRRRNY